MKDTLLTVKDLRVDYETDAELVHAVNGISFSIEKGRTLGLVGETGAGKTTTALAILRLLPERTAKYRSGSIYFERQDLLPLTDKAMQEIRGSKISMVFQDPMSALNPIMTVGDQIAEAILLHKKEDMTHTKVNEMVDSMLELVGIPCSRKHEYPHQFSGGMKQRIIIAIALVCEPELLIADEPTSALDVTMQAQVLSMIMELKNRLHTSMLMISHDLGVIARTCDEIAVMYAGEIIEKGTSRDLFTGTNHHPYTTGLMGALPSLSSKSKRLSPILGAMPDPTNLPTGCKFAPRCKHCTDLCKSMEPPIIESGSHIIKCHLFAQGGKKYE